MKVPPGVKAFLADAFTGIAIVGLPLLPALIAVIVVVLVRAL